MPLEWRDAMGIGHAVIDADHRHLIEIINCFEASPDLVHAEETARALLEHARNHFSREEVLQRVSGYPLCTLHRIAHQELLDKLKDLIRTFFVDQRSRDPGVVVEVMRDLIRDWFLGHVIEMDMKMKPFIARLPKNVLDGSLAPEERENYSAA
ncbi:MAG TPA: hemerythrin domain-containing protein [Candidatus Sulfotelmatobacter sp.]|jgi:hemerythrin-like metal-binding protein|nr:hemerythrin domain-containing protein [Candidatus Sulfotelmatobacter sp.]